MMSIVAYVERVGYLKNVLWLVDKVDDVTKNILYFSFFARGTLIPVTKRFLGVSSSRSCLARK